MTAFVISSLMISGSARQVGERRGPRSPVRSPVILAGQSLNEIERRLKGGNLVEEIFGGEGMQLRVAVQHEKDKPAGLAEVHDDSDDVYYVLDGAATLVLGGALDSPREVEPGEWRGALGIGLLSGGYGRDELERAGAYRVYDDPADLLRHLDEVGVRALD